MKRVYFFLFACMAILVSSAQPLKRVAPAKVGMDAHQLTYADTIIQTAISQGDIPGAVLAVVRHGKMAYLKAYGNRQTYPFPLPMTTDTHFDMASCSKCMSTTMCIMKLIEQGKIRLQDPVNMYIPGFLDWTDAKDKEQTNIRIYHLLTHSSGLRPYVDWEEVMKKYGSPCPDSLMVYISKMRRDFKPGTAFQYSCLNFVTLQHIIENITGQSLRDFAQNNIFRPLGMTNTDYLPCAPDTDGEIQNIAVPEWATLDNIPNEWKTNIAPTVKLSDGHVLTGIVHDQIARFLQGGISGNAGLFSTADDIAILCATLQNGGEYRGQRILAPQTVNTMRTVPRELTSLGRALGWDSYSTHSSNKGDLFSSETYCHTGFTGTNIVIDPVTDTSVILLINSVHPELGHSVLRLRSLVSNIIASSIIE